MSKAASKRRSSAARRRSSGGVNWIWVLAGIAVAAIIGALIFQFARQTAVIEGEEKYGPFPGNVHVAGTVTYAQSPPVGGEHASAWQNCGIYAEPIPNERAVHSLEHGAVWLTYRPDLPAEQIEQLRNLVRGRSYTLMSPYPDLDRPIAVSGWGVQLKVDSPSDERLPRFIAKYRQGTQTPEPGAACVGGVGTPTER
jgi:hypothetical protein